MWVMHISSYNCQSMACHGRGCNTIVCAAIAMYAMQSLQLDVFLNIAVWACLGLVACVVFSIALS